MLFIKFELILIKIGHLCIACLCTVPADQLRLPESREIVLDYIIERKRMDDLSDSIIDRRFNEQKV